MPEVAGDAALFVDPYDTGNIAAAIMKILESPDLAEDLRKKGFARASRFSWETTASKVLEVLESVAGGMKR
jgi:glycosyltransferase involved in cell wall biosynthesis